MRMNFKSCSIPKLHYILYIVIKVLLPLKLMNL